MKFDFKVLFESWAEVIRTKVTKWDRIQCLNDLAWNFSENLNNLKYIVDYMASDNKVLLRAIKIKRTTVYTNLGFDIERLSQVFLEQKFYDKYLEIFNI